MKTQQEKKFKAFNYITFAFKLAVSLFRCRVHNDSVS